MKHLIRGAARRRAIIKAGVPCIAAFVAVCCSCRVSHGQALMMGADGAVHLDEASGVSVGSPVVIQQAPTVLQPSGGAWCPPMMMQGGYGACTPQCQVCQPYSYMMMQQPAPPPQPLGLLDRIREADMQWVVGAEFLYARATFSEATAYIATDPGFASFDFVQFDFDYEPSWGAFGGVHMREWGGTVLFEYAQLNSEAEVTASTGGGVVIITPIDPAVALNLTANAEVDLETYDLSFAKSIRCGGTGAACGSNWQTAPHGATCGCRWAPKWELTAAGGVRYANVEWTRNVVGNDATSGVLFRSTSSTMNFDGLGPRIGLTGRRYLGTRGWVSMYAKGDWSILFGEVDLNTVTSRNAPGPLAARFNNDQLIPVTEIELGATAHIGRWANLSAGYFWSAWHDLGMRDATFPVAAYDDANILGFDGLFARAEITF